MLEEKTGDAKPGQEIGGLAKPDQETGKAKPGQEIGAGKAGPGGRVGKARPVNLDRQSQGQ